jgi:hypothetical protein
MSPLVQATTPREHRGLIALLFGTSAAPIAWLGQVMLAYGVSAYLCYPADHPVMTAHGDALHGLLIGTDIAAIAIALAGGFSALGCLRKAEGPRQGRVRFLAVWGVFSSLCFLIAILFSIIASVTVPLCTR